MNKQKKLVFFGAHPDDETFGLGTTLAQYAVRGVKVYYVCATGGEVGTVDRKYMKGFNTIAELRAEEMRCAAREVADRTVISYKIWTCPSGASAAH